MKDQAKAVARLERTIQKIVSVRAKLASGEKLSRSDKRVLSIAHDYLGGADDASLAIGQEAAEQQLAAFKDDGSAGYTFEGRSALPEESRTMDATALGAIGGKTMYLISKNSKGSAATPYFDLTGGEVFRTLLHEADHNVRATSDTSIGGTPVYGSAMARKLAKQDPSSAMRNPETMAYFLGSVR